MKTNWERKTNTFIYFHIHILVFGKNISASCNTNRNTFKICKLNNYVTIKIDYKNKRMSDLFFYNVIYIVLILRKHYIINTLYILM